MFSGMFGAARGNTSLVTRWPWHPDNRNAVIMVDPARRYRPLCWIWMPIPYAIGCTRRQPIGRSGCGADQAGSSQQMPGAGAANTYARRDADRWASISSAVWRTPSGCGLKSTGARKAVAIFAEAEPFVPSG